MYGLLINGGVYDFMNFTAERFENTSYGEKGNQCIARYFDIHFLSRNRSIHVVRIVNYKNGLHTYVWGGGGVTQKPAGKGTFPLCTQKSCAYTVDNVIIDPIFFLHHLYVCSCVL